MCHFVLRSQAHIDTMQESPVFLIVRASDRPNFLQDLYDQELTPPSNFQSLQTPACVFSCARQELAATRASWMKSFISLYSISVFYKETPIPEKSCSSWLQENICPLVEYIGFLNSDHCVFINFQGRCSISTHPCSLLLRVQMPTSKP